MRKSDTTSKGANAPAAAVVVQEVLSASTEQVELLEEAGSAPAIVRPPGSPGRKSASVSFAGAP